MKISLELVPNNKDQLLQELNFTKLNFPEIETINIPDLLRFEMRSWDGCQLARESFNNTIPHIRAIDIDLKQPLHMAQKLVEGNITQVLVVAGDPPQEMNRKIFHTTSLEAISKFKNELPGIKVYAAIDPYRGSLKQELLNVKRKTDAGADGFFTQPFFDMRHLNIYHEMFEDLEIYFGVSPVLSESSRNYWHAKNHVVFPKGFVPSLEWNTHYACEVLSFCRENNRNIYFMPIKMRIEHYLNQILRQK